jgi:2-oxoglutarate dehydrogenase E2 component (dihydrolipoamide succinyltransferase)
VVKPLAPSKSPARAEEQLPSAVRPEAVTPGGGGEAKVVPMSMLRRAVARRLVEAQQQMAMLTTFNEADMQAVQTLRKEQGEAFEKRHQVKLGLTSFFVKAVLDALEQFPQLNAEIRGDDIVYHNHFDIGVAIGTGRGLVVPVLRDAQRLSFAQIETSVADFAARAKDGTLRSDELRGGTFTITNGGVFGSLLSTPIVNPPQTGILGLHAIQDRPVARDNQVVIRPMMYLALTYDHRIVDGREAVLFLRRIKEVIESPVRILTGA